MGFRHKSRLVQSLVALQGWVLTTIPGTAFIEIGQPLEVAGKLTLLDVGTPGAEVTLVVDEEDTGLRTRTEADGGYKLTFPGWKSPGTHTLQAVAPLSFLKDVAGNQAQVTVPEPPPLQILLPPDGWAKLIVKPSIIQFGKSTRVEFLFTSSSIIASVSISGAGVNVSLQVNTGSAAYWQNIENRSVVLTPTEEGDIIVRVTLSFPPFAAGGSASGAMRSIDP